MTIELEELDWKAVEVLETLADLDGRASTSEVREHSAVETNQEILYRVDEKLEPSGYISSFQPSSDTPLIPPKELELTTEGERLVAEIRESKNEKPTIEDLPDKIEHLSSKLDQVQSRIEGLEPELGETQNERDTTPSEDYSTEVAELRTQLRSQQKQLDRLEKRLETFENQTMGAWSAGKQEEFETLWDAMIAMRRFIENEVEPQTSKSLREYR